MLNELTRSQMDNELIAIFLNVNKIFVTLTSLIRFCGLKSLIKSENIKFY